MNGEWVKEQRIEGEYGFTTLVEGGYQGVDLTPEQRERERLADRMTRTELQKQGMPPAAFDSQGFPPVIAHIFKGRVFVKREPVYSKELVNKWLQLQHDLAAALPRRVK